MTNIDSNTQYVKQKYKYNNNKLVLRSRLYQGDRIEILAAN